MNKKTKILTFGLSALALVSVTTVGFSSWLIYSGDATGTENISVVVADNNAKGVEMEVGAITPTTGFRLDADPTDNEGAIRFSSSSADDSGELLTVKYQYTVTLTSAEVSSLNITGKYEWGAGMKTFASNNYIVLPVNDGATTTLVSSGTPSSGTTLVASTTYTFETSVTLAWGSAFGGMNPSRYDSNSEQVAAAKTALEAMKSATNLTLKVTLTASLS